MGLDSDIYRLHCKMQLHDTGAIMATHSNFSSGENNQRNNKLNFQLRVKRYRVVKLGSKEKYSFFVDDWKDEATLEEDLRKLGEEWEQDAVLFIPKGGTKSKLWGTNPSKSDYGKSDTKSTVVYGKVGERFTWIRNCPFMYFTIECEYDLPDSWGGKLALFFYSKRDWRKFDKISV